MYICREGNVKGLGSSVFKAAHKTKLLAPKYQPAASRELSLHRLAAQRLGPPARTSEIQKQWEHKGYPTTLCLVIHAEVPLVMVANL